MNFLSDFSFVRPSQYSGAFFFSEMTTALHEERRETRAAERQQKSKDEGVRNVTRQHKKACSHAPVVFEPLALLRLDLVPQRHVLELVRLAGLVLAVEAEQAVGESHVDVGRRDRLPRHKDLFAPLRPDEGWSGGHCCLWSARKV